MEIIKSFIDLFVHLDAHMVEIVAQYGLWVYAIVFVIIFAETGLVITPFLPGDSLLFVLGALAAQGTLDLTSLLIIITSAAILGDMVNYHIGRLLAPKVFNNERIPFMKREYLERTQQFYEKYGAKTIVLARFVPIVRTFAPFLAGVGNMSYAKFALYNVSGAILWVLVCVISGFFFGNLPFVSENFSMVILVIVFLSIIPVIFEILKHRKKS